MPAKSQEADRSPPNRLFSPSLNLQPANSPPDLYTSAVAYFTSTPWTAAHLPPSDSSAVPFIPSCRNPLTREHDQLFGRTLASPNALRHMLCVFRPRDPDHVRDPARPIEEVRTLCAVGDGLSGVPGVVHGGMTMAIVDEAMGMLPELNAALGKNGEVYQTGSVTGSLEIKFLRPVPVGGIVCATAWLASTERRKSKIECVVKDEEGTELARCSSTWVAVRPSM